VVWLSCAVSDVCVCVCVVSYMTHRISMRVDTCKAVPSVCVCVCETPKEDPTVNTALRKRAQPRDMSIIY